MKKICIFLISFVFLINTEVYSKSYKELYDDGLKAIKEGGKIIFLRHAYAPRTVENGDNDKNYKDKDCSTQRDILKEGIRQSKEISNFVISNNIEIDKVISSPTCRTYKTAKYAGWDYKIDKNLRNTRKKSIQEKRFKNIKKIVSSWNGEGNLVLVTHFKVINPLFPGVKSDSGEMVIANNDLRLLGRIKFKYDPTIKD
jgi:phosphohistidine phosphatase SixA